jgi:hypothetical protein
MFLQTSVLTRAVQRNITEHGILQRENSSIAELLTPRSEPFLEAEIVITLMRCVLKYALT